ncbi:hypothetical protein B6A42_10270 [Vibrio coralliilyticus]|nr:hypothetical protein B6A42_10270 [Vibrio coralliilyticus]
MNVDTLGYYTSVLKSYLHLWLIAILESEQTHLTGLILEAQRKVSSGRNKQRDNTKYKFF